MMNLIHAVAGRPWAIQAEIAFHVRDLMAKEGIAGLRHLAELKADVHAFDNPARPRGGSAPAAVAVIPVIGTLTQRRQMVGSADTRSTADVAAEVRAAVMSQGVDAVLLEVDSPGGEVFGVPEAWASIRESARMKPVIAHANSVAASAALYLASAATEFWITPSGQAGSVGVYALHVDASKAIEASGETWDFIVASKSPYKVEGAPNMPLTDEARSHMQQSVDRYMEMFIRDLAKGRGMSASQIESGFGGGRMLGPTEAVKVGMADGVAPFDQAVRRAAELSRKPRAGVRAEAVGMDATELEIRARLAGAKLTKE